MRKIIQILEIGDCFDLLTLCEDGAVWYRYKNEDDRYVWAIHMMPIFQENLHANKEEPQCEK